MLLVGLEPPSLRIRSPTRCHCATRAADFTGLVLKFKRFNSSDCSRSLCDQIFNKNHCFFQFFKALFEFVSMMKIGFFVISISYFISTASSQCVPNPCSNRKKRITLQHRNNLQSTLIFIKPACGPGQTYLPCHGSCYSIST